METKIWVDNKEVDMQSCEIKSTVFALPMKKGVAGRNGYLAVYSENDEHNDDDGYVVYHGYFGSKEWVSKGIFESTLVNQKEQ